jgi:hypothetical protein
MKRYRAAISGDISSGATMSDEESSEDVSQTSCHKEVSQTSCYEDGCEASIGSPSVNSDSAECTGLISETHIAAEMQTTAEFLSHLAAFAVNSQLSREHLSQLLLILRNSGRFHRDDIPKDPRTLLDTPRVVNVVNKCNGDYIFFGLEQGIINVIEQSGLKIDCINVDINVDGLPLHKSSNVQFWPILCRVVESQHQPFVVALYCGNHKPSNVHEFMHDFIIEANSLYENGLTISDKNVSVRVRAFICDAPARAFVKCIVGHTAKNGCERCTTEAVAHDHRILFLNDVGDLRTDAKFREGAYPLHKIADSPVMKMNVDIIRSFVLDSMHLLFLGVCKRLLSFLKVGPRSVRLSHMQMDVISKRLLEITKFTPSDFGRRPRSLFQMERWKATELRQFTLYTGMIVLKGVVSDALYDIFLCFFVAVRILHIADRLQRNRLLNFARNLFSTFVNNSKVVCGATFVTYNVHNLLHICDDVEHFQCSLSELSSFPFENYLQCLKHMVRGAKSNPLASAAKRFGERTKCVTKTVDHTIKVSAVRRDKYFINADGKYCEVVEVCDDGQIVCNVYDPRKMQSLFSKLMDSRNWGILKMENVCKSKQKLKTVQLSDVKQKLYVFKENDGLLFVPVLHHFGARQ